MFNYSSTTIINSDKDFTSGKPMFASLSANEKHGAILRILRDYTFEAPYIQKIYPILIYMPGRRVRFDQCRFTESGPTMELYAYSTPPPI